MARRADHLASLPLFASCSARERQRIARVADELTVPEGTVLTTEGGIGREAFVIIDGSCDVERAGLRLARLGPGDHFGEMALLDGGPRTATVTTTSETKLLVLSKRAFNGVLDEVPSLTRKLLESLARRLRDSEQSLSH